MKYDMLILLMCPKNRNVYGFATIELKMPELIKTNKSKNWVFMESVVN